MELPLGQLMDEGGEEVVSVGLSLLEHRFTS
jgi:hypothetical protein